MATYNTLTPEIIEQLKQAAPGHILTGEEINEDYSHDEMPIYGKHSPDVLLMATSTEEIAAVMKICNDNLIPVTPRGAGTGLAGGCVPVDPQRRRNRPGRRMCPGARRRADRHHQDEKDPGL